MRNFFKVATTFLVVFLSLSLNGFAQENSLTIGFGVKNQNLSLWRDSTNVGEGLKNLIAWSGGDINKIIDQKIKVNMTAPTLEVGYIFHLGRGFSFNPSISSSMDWKESFKLGGTFAAQGKTYPFPKSMDLGVNLKYVCPKGGAVSGLTVGLRGMYSYGFRSKYILKKSNIQEKVVVELNKLSSNLNLLSATGSKFFQYQAEVGYTKNLNNHLEIGGTAFFGRAGEVRASSVGMQLFFRYLIKNQKTD